MLSLLTAGWLCLQLHQLCFREIPDTAMVKALWVLI